MYQNIFRNLLIAASMTPFLLIAGCENERYSQEEQETSQKEEISWYMKQTYQCDNFIIQFHHARGLRGIQVGDNPIDVGEESIDIEGSNHAMVTEGEQWIFRDEAENIGRLINKSSGVTHKCRYVERPYRMVNVREKFPTMRACLDSIISRTGRKIRSTITDTPSRVTGILRSGTEFSCTMEATGTEGVYFESYYRAKEFI